MTADRKVALLIPVYNNQDGLARSLEALPGEVPLDIVVVDDGSTPPIELPAVFPWSEEIWRTMHARNCFIHPAVMMRVPALREVGLYSDRYEAVEDFELFFRMVERFKAANLPDYVVMYELNPQGISLTKRKKQILGRLKVMLRHFDPRIKESWLGLIKNTLLLFAPVKLVQTLKRRLEGRRGWL